MKEQISEKKELKTEAIRKETFKIFVKEYCKCKDSYYVKKKGGGKLSLFCNTCGRIPRIQAEYIKLKDFS